MFPNDDDDDDDDDCHTMAVVHIDHQTSSQTVNTFRCIDDLRRAVILADKKDVILATNFGDVIRFTPSTGEEEVLFKYGAQHFDFYSFEPLLDWYKGRQFGDRETER